MAVVSMSSATVLVVTGSATVVLAPGGTEVVVTVGLDTLLLAHAASKAASSARASRFGGLLT